MKTIGYIMILLPVMFIYIIGGYTYYKTNSDEDIKIKGKCIETYTVNHWYKSSPPTTTVHTVVRLNQKAYIVDGECDNGVKQIPWHKEHNILYIFGGIGEVVILITLVIIGLAILCIWGMTIRVLLKYDKTKSFRENWNAIYKESDDEN